MKVIYKGVEYFLIHESLGGILEIAPTPHGAGSIIVHKDFVEIVK